MGPVSKFPGHGVRAIEKALKSENNYEKYIAILYADKFMTPEDFEKANFKSLQREIRQELDHIKSDFPAFLSACASNPL